MSFQDNLAQGMVAESAIANWVKSRGSSVMPAYQVEKHSGKGPQLFTFRGGFVAPDMLVFSDHGIQWIESKHKSVFTWHRKTSQWTTGIDLKHYADYLHVAKQTKLPVWLLFFHRESHPSADDLASGCPKECPTGLFGGELFSLVVKVHHQSPSFDPERSGMKGHGKSGMVYWAADDMRLLATKEEVLAASRQMQIAA